MEGTTTATLATFIEAVGTMFNSVIGWLTKVGSAIIGDPILLAFCALPLIGLAVGLYRRLMNVN